MHPQRRIRLLLIAVFVILLFIIYLTHDGRRVQKQRFYQQTVEAINNQKLQQQAREDDDGSSLFKKLKPGVGEERVVAPDRQRYGDDSSPGSRHPPAPKGIDDNGVIEGDVPDARKLRPPEDGEDEISIAGRKKMPADRGSDKSEFDPEIETELNAILKKSPIIVFSKTYCPFSRKAKHILLEKYNIVPAPFVVELDQHSLGPKLQEVIAGNTGRKTVPNILISGRSIGGGDEIEDLDESGGLAGKIRELAGKRVTEVSPRQKREKGL